MDKNKIIIENKKISILKVDYLKPENFFENGKYKDVVVLKQISSEKKFDQKHELIGFEYFKKNSYDPLLRIHGKLHGFDGLFIKDKLYFYEAKFKSANNLNSFITSATKTIQKPVKGRKPELGNTIDKLIMSKNSREIVTYKNKIELKSEFDIDETIKKIELILKDISLNKKTTIKNEEMLLTLGSKGSLTTSKANKEALKKLDIFEKTLVIEYD